MLSLGLPITAAGASQVSEESDGKVTPVTIGIVGIGMLILLMLIGMPIGFSMAFVGLAGFCYLVSLEAGLSILARDVFASFSNYALTTIPMFVLMGCIAFASGMSRRLYDTGYAMFGQRRGGLAIATIAACAGFAAICGSTAATAAAMGRVSLPEMKRYNYADSLATASVAAAGSLGILIPPSTCFIVYGIMTEQSIGKLFMAGVFPGLLLASFFMAVVYVLCLRNPSLAPAALAPISWKEKIGALTGAVDTAILFSLVIGGLFLGWFSPTQAGAVGAAGTLLLGFVRRELNWQKLLLAVKDALRITSWLWSSLPGLSFLAILWP